jgi:hypothetical protein
MSIDIVIDPNTAWAFGLVVGVTFAVALCLLATAIGD